MQGVTGSSPVVSTKMNKSTHLGAFVHFWRHSANLLAHPTLNDFGRQHRFEAPRKRRESGSKISRRATLACKAAAREIFFSKPRLSPPEKNSSKQGEVFSYPSRRLGIDARRLAIPSLRSLHHRAKCGGYHQPLRGWISSRISVYPSAAWWYTTLRVGDIQNYVLMIYTPRAWLGCENAKSSWIALPNMI